jgi:hypothetical protein
MSPSWRSPVVDVPDGSNIRIDPPGDDAGAVEVVERRQRIGEVDRLRRGVDHKA